MLDFYGYLYFYLLILICFCLISWGLIKPERIYQYPFIMGGVFSIFILPQAFALINNPAPATSEALSRLFLMSCLCAFMCWFGYQFPANSNFLRKLDIQIDYNRVWFGAIILVVIAYIAHFLILQRFAGS